MPLKITPAPLPGAGERFLIVDDATGETLAVVYAGPAVADLVRAALELARKAVTP